MGGRIGGCGIGGLGLSLRRLDTTQYKLLMMSKRLALNENAQTTPPQKKQKQKPRSLKETMGRDTQG